LWRFGSLASVPESIGDQRSGKGLGVEDCLGGCEVAQAVMDSKLSIRVVTDPGEFVALRECWNELLQRCEDNNVYLTWEWLFAHWSHYGQGSRLSILLVEDQGRVIGIAPLMCSTYGRWPLRFKVLENISVADTDYSGVILAERKEEAVSALLEYIDEATRRDGVTVRLTQLPQGSRFLELLEKEYPRFSSSLVLDKRVMATCPYLPLPATWDEFFYSVRRKRRNNLRRALRALEKDFEVRFERATGGNDLKERVSELIDLHQRRWQGEGLRGTFASQQAREFYIDVAEEFCRRGWLDLSFMRVNGRAISAVYGLKYGGKFYYMLTAFDPAYADYSAGNVHIMRLIQDAIKRGIREFDFVVGGGGYKFYWTQHARQNIGLVVMRRRFPARARLRLFRAFMRLRSVLRRSPRENLRLYLLKRKQRQVREAADSAARVKC